MSDYWQSDLFVAVVIRCLSAVIADAENEFVNMGRYAWDSEFYCGVPTHAFRSHMWLDAIAVHEIASKPAVR